MTGDKEEVFLDLSDVTARQRAYFRSGATLPLPARRRALESLLQGLTDQEGALLAALEADLGKPSFEGYMTELGLVREELRFHLKHLGRWTRPRRVPTPLAHFPARSTVRPEPYGSVLILSPWNYPIQLSLMPLIGALSAGNCAVLKPSAYAPACSRALAELVARSLPPELAAVVEGKCAENQALLDLPFDYIFFTGSPTVGRIVMERAAARLTPVTLELGGKSPVIVTKDADLALAARRILFGKLLNSGQTCVAPDYVLVQRDVLPELIRLLQAELTAQLGTDPLACPDYPRIVNAAHLRRLEGLLEGCQVLCGGQTGGGRMAPTLVLPPSPDAPVMQEEIFGPILPLLPFDTLEEAVSFVQDRPRPLALYLFTKSREVERAILDRIPFGGGCVNDTVVHLSTPYLPFGGVGASGMGSYHGRASFETFSHPKSILKKGAGPDLPVRYRPYAPWKEKLLRKFLP